MAATCLEEYPDIPLDISSASSGPWSACYTSHDPYNPKRQQGFLEWTADGSALIFDHDAYTYQVEQTIWSVREDGSQLRRATQTTPPGTGHTASSYGFHGDLSPDGKYLVHSTCIFESQWDDDTTIRAPELAVSRMDGSRPAQITKSETFKNYPAWSPDGTRITYVGNYSEGGAYPALPTEPLRIWILELGPDTNLESDLDGKWPFRTPLTGEREYLVDTTPEWSPDGEYEEEDGRHLAFLNPTEFSVSEHAPVWSPDSSHLAYLAHQDNLWSIHITEIDRVKVAKTAVIGLSDEGETRHISAMHLASPAWAPDSSALAFAQNQPDGRGTIHITTPDGTKIKEINGLPYPVSHIDWHPDGSEILVAAGGLWRIKTKDWKPQPIARAGWIHPPEGERSKMTGIAWSPDGTRLAARTGPLKHEHSGFWLITMNSDGTDVRLPVVHEWKHLSHFRACGRKITLADAFGPMGGNLACN